MARRAVVALATRWPCWTPLGNVRDPSLWSHPHRSLMPWSDAMTRARISGYEGQTALVTAYASRTAPR